MLIFCSENPLENYGVHLLPPSPPEIFSDRPPSLSEFPSPSKSTILPTGYKHNTELTSNQVRSAMPGECESQSQFFI